MTCFWHLSLPLDFSHFLQVQERLKPFLPQGESLPPTAEELQATVKSAQFRQAMRTFSEALASGQLGPVMKQFGLPAAAQEAATKGGEC